jgi:hypothetical protein
VLWRRAISAVDQVDANNGYLRIPARQACGFNIKIAVHNSVLLYYGQTPICAFHMSWDTGVSMPELRE